MVANTSGETINSLLDEMRPLLIVAGIPQKQIRIRDGRLQIKTLSAAFDWLHDFKMSSEYEELVAVWGLLPEATWKRYKLFEIQDLREQVLLAEAVKKIARKWRSKRPGVFNANRKRRPDAEKK